jgi:hypothetical protein
LPCIYCRQSFHQYVRELPIDGYLGTNRDLSFWLYSIHNKVNDKLLGQNLYVEENRDFLAVHEGYLKLVKEVNREKCYNPLPGWDLLYCILFNYPALPDVIEPIRREQYLIFFRLFPEVLPFENFKKVYRDHLRQFPIGNCLNRRDLKLWGYRLERDYCRAVLLICPKFKERCQSIEMFRAGCNGKNDPKPTCHITT